MMAWRRGIHVSLYLLATVAAVCPGCADGTRRSRKLPPEPTPGTRATPDAVLAGTVGTQTVVGAAQPLRLRGYGLVVGLGENGGSDCPTIIREYLLDTLSKQTSARGPSRDRVEISPRRLLDSLDTAVVIVHGVVPGGSTRGAPFDLQLAAIGSQTRSLEGGLLLPCELRRFEATAVGRELVTGPALARAGGLVFTNPVSNASDPIAAQQTPRRGYVLGGGKTLDARPVRLLMQEPSYWMARRIERRLNERFGQSPATAKAESKGYLRLYTPARYADEPARFLQLATHLFLENTPALNERKLVELAEHLDGPEETLNHISLIWEAMGRTVLPRIQPLYMHANPLVRFHAARAGLRLRDINALAPMFQIARDATHPRRLEAIYELGRSDFPQAVMRLAKLLDEDDDVVRIAAYDALLNHHHPAVETKRFMSLLDPTQVNLTLDIVDSSARPLIYVRRMLEPRIAVFGRRTPIILPLFYNHPDDWVTLNALEARGDITVVFRTRSGRVISDQMVVEPRVVELVRALSDLPLDNGRGRISGIGLAYTQVVQVLDALCKSGAIPGKLVLQGAKFADLLGPTEIPERPEGDEPPPPAERSDENAGDASGTPGRPE